MPTGVVNGVAVKAKRIGPRSGCEASRISHCEGGAAVAESAEQRRDRSPAAIRARPWAYRSGRMCIDAHRSRMTARGLQPPALHHNPAMQIHTPRLLLRRFTLDDADFIV